MTEFEKTNPILLRLKTLDQLKKRTQSMTAEHSLKKTKPTLGFEPRTAGLQNQSSTVELRWHKSDITINQ